MARTGRPTKLDQVVRTTPTGTTITVADTVIEAVRAGCFPEAAAAAAGINRSTLYDWQRVGARALQRMANGTPRSALSRKERLCADFSDRILQAYAEATAIEVTTAAQLARGGLKLNSTTTRTETTPTGVKVTTTTKVDELAPDSAMLRWRLAQRERETWGKAAALEVTGADGGPIELSLSEKRARVLEGLEVLAASLTQPPDVAELAEEATA